MLKTAQIERRLLELHYGVSLECLGLSKRHEQQLAIDRGKRMSVISF